MDASVALGTELPEVATRSFDQFSYDNVDHNLKTLDEKGTIHVIVIITMVRPGAKSQRQTSRMNFTG